MKVLLILPPFGRLYGFGRGYFPVGLGYLAGYLESRGVDVRILNAEMGAERRIENPKYADYDRGFRRYREKLHDRDFCAWKEVRAALRGFAPDLVGVSVMTAMAGSAAQVSRIAREVDPRVRIVWGGAHPTILPEEVLRNADVDFVVRKEGEHALLDLCDALERGADEYGGIGGLSYKKKDGGIAHNPDREYIQDLDTLPFPARHLDLRKDLYAPDQMAVLVASRGCPFRCGYCGAASVWSRAIRYRSPGNVLAEIEKVRRDHGIDTFFFWDDSFTASRKRVSDLCDAIMRRELEISFSVTTRVDLVDREILSVMKQAGLFSVDFGIETGSPRMLELIDKGVTERQIMRAIELCNELRIGWNAFFMIGFPEETEEDIGMTLDFIKKINPAETCLSIFTPYPGTALYEKAKELGLVSEPVDWAVYSHQSPENHFVRAIPKERFRVLAAKAARIIDSQNSVNAWRRRMAFLFRHPVKAVLKAAGRVRQRLGVRD